MAYYAALLSIIELLEDILHPHRFPNSFPDDDTPTFNSLHQKFCQLLDSLQDYSSIGRDADPIESIIRDASYQALDFIESQIPEHKRLSLGPQLGRFDWEEKLLKVGQEVDAIVQELTAMKQSHHVAADASGQQQEQLSIDFGNKDTNTTVGFEEQLAAVKEKLFASSTQLQVISIVGMGGIGKTTLARHTFDDARILSQFDFRGWVTITQDYHVIRVLRDIVKSLGVAPLEDDLCGDQDPALVKEHERQKEIALKERIHKHLKWRRFLIVVDDVWSTNVWDDIHHMFPNDGNGSRILLTTRLADVAGYVGSINSLYRIQFLDANASWTLLQEKAFVKERCGHGFVSIGKHIASKCGGLPLAIVVIGGILSNNRTIGHWERVANNVSLILNKEGEHLSNILSLSYNQLPHHLKPCFLHLGIFKEGYEINISKLVKMWIAEGFIKSITKSRNLEKIGAGYLKDLARRSLVMITKKKSNGEFKCCVMHDLLIDFCKQRVHDEHFFHVTNRHGNLKTNGVEKVRRVVVDSSVPLTQWKIRNAEYIRSICQFRMQPFSVGVGALKWDRVNLLRIFGVPLQIPVVPIAVPYMHHLKFLILTPSYKKWTREYCIDPSISKLQNLEVLMIDCQGFELILPPEIWKMSWLKHLFTSRRVVLPTIPNDITLQKLEHLHTLQTLDSFVFTNEATQMIPNVRKLKIAYQDMKGGDMWDRYRLDDLINLIQLEKLTIIFRCSIFPCDYLLWSVFAFPQNLKKLSLCGCELQWEAMTIAGSLKYLQVLKLRHDAFVGEVWEPAEGEFRELKFLFLERLDLMHWRAESTHFPKLQHLKINLCKDLEEIPLDIGEIGTLQCITVDGSKQAGDSAKKIQEEQHDLGNYGLQVIVRS